MSDMKKLIETLDKIDEAGPERTDGMVWDFGPPNSDHLNNQSDDIQIPKALLDEIFEVLDAHMFSEDGEFNNDDVIQVLKKVQNYRKAGM